MPKKAPKKKEYGLAIDNLPGYFLIFCVIASLIGLFFVVKRFLPAIIVAAILTIAFYPVYKRLTKVFKGRNWLASILSVLLVVVVIVVPVTLLILLLSREAFDTYVFIEEKVSSGALDQFLKWEDGGYLFDLKQRLLPVIDLDTVDIKSSITNTAQTVSSFLVTQSANFLKGFTTFMLDFAVMLFAMYYFFKDGKVLKKKLIEFMPLPTTYERKIFNKLEDMVGAIIYGLFLTAVAQGVLGGIGFALAGVSNAIFWGALVAFFALIPLIGTGVIMAPAGILLLLTGNIAAGVFLLLWGFFIVGLVDNILKPYLVSGKAHTYPLLTFLSIFGGIFAFGMKGILFGPVIMMLAVTFLYIYRLEYKPVLKE